MLNKGKIIEIHSRINFMQKRELNPVNYYNTLGNCINLFLSNCLVI